MADPHNPARYGEVWTQHRIDAWKTILEALKPFVVFSGGWAWHFLSPPAHMEYKHAHDHKDCDLMVPPRTVATVMGILQSLGFKKVATKYDRLPSDEDFRRYEKVVTRHICHGNVSESPHECFCLPSDDCTKDTFRLTIDFFVKDVPALQTPGGWLVVRPDVLVGFYSTIHSSQSCWAVVNAKTLLDRGRDPGDIIENPRLLEVP